MKTLRRLTGNGAFLLVRLTTEGQLAKNPKMFGLMKVAQQISETWRAEDTKAAQEQRAAAEAEIKRLSEIAA